MQLLYKIKHGTEYLNYGREIVVKYCERCETEGGQNESFHILDLGAGSGTDLMNCMKKVAGGGRKRVELWALESYPPNIRKLESQGIHVRRFNIERERFPFEDESMDFVILNQILEHTKEVFWIFSEISRILKKGGGCIVGVPNLASFHNRIALLFGRQPTSIRTLGPHVRGFTKNDFINFVETDGYFRVEYFAGSNFYPFPPRVSRFLARMFPSHAVSLFWGIRRTGKKGRFIHVLDSRFYETPYYRGINEIDEG